MSSCLNDIEPVVIDTRVKKCFLCKVPKPLSEYDPDRRKYQLKPDMNTCKVCKICDYNRALDELSIVRYNYETEKFEVIKFKDKEDVKTFYSNTNILSH